MKAIFAGLLFLVSASLEGHRGTAGENADAFAAPEITMIHGGSLKERVVIANWKENLALTTGLVEHRSVPDSALKGRPFFEMAFFWGSGWRNYSSVPDSLRKLQPSQGNQFARLYPAHRGAPPLVVFRFGMLGGLPSRPYRSVDKDALALLAKYGVGLHQGAIPSHRAAQP